MNRSISSVGLIHGNTQGSPRRLRPSCALGVRHQTAREGVRRRSHQAPGGNIPIGLHRLRSGAEGIQRRTRPRTLAGQLSAEGAPVRVDEQPQRRLAAAHEAGIPGYLDVLEGPQEQGSPVVASYFVGSVGGAPITILRQYIEGQNPPSAGAL